MSKILCYFIVLLCMSSGFVYGQDTIKTEVYKGPERLEAVMPEYPISERKKGGEGWVVFSYMVDQEGDVFEPVIIDSTGSKSLEDAASKALLETKYKPAVIGDKVVDASSSMMYTFVLEGKPSSAGKYFIKKFNHFMIRIDKDEKTDAKRILSEMIDNGALNLYENAYLNLANFVFESKYGNKTNQMKYLNRALSYESYGNELSRVNYLPDERALPLRRNLFQLEVELKRYAEAINTFEIFKEIGDSVAIEAFNDIYEKIKNYKVSDSSYSISSELDSNGSWGMEVFKDEFYIDVTKGKLEELKLRCTGKYVFFAYNVDAQYKLPESWGDCHLEVLGAEGSKFNLVQL